VIAPSLSWQGGTDFTGVFGGASNAISHVRMKANGTEDIWRILDDKDDPRL